MLATSGTDGRDGVEGIRRLAALLHCAVELEGHPLDGAAFAARPEATAALTPAGTLDGETLAWVLGPSSTRAGPPQSRPRRLRTR